MFKLASFNQAEIISGHKSNFSLHVEKTVEAAISVSETPSSERIMQPTPNNPHLSFVRIVMVWVLVSGSHTFVLLAFRWIQKVLVAAPGHP